MLQKFATYFTFAEFNRGTPATAEQFRAELSQFNGPAVVYLCGVMNSVIADWQGNRRADAHEELVRNTLLRRLPSGSSPNAEAHKTRAVFTTGSKSCLSVRKRSVCARKAAEKIPWIRPTAGR